MHSNGFTIDKQEYQSVFKVFDKDNSGELTIQQVNHFINKFDQIQTVHADLPTSTNNKMLTQGKPGARQLQQQTQFAQSTVTGQLINGQLLAMQNGSATMSKATTKASSTAGQKKVSSPNKRISGAGPIPGSQNQQVQGLTQMQQQYQRGTSLVLKATQLETQTSSGIKQQATNLIGNGASGKSGTAKGELGQRAIKGTKDGEGMNYERQQFQEGMASQHHSSSSEDAGAFNSAAHQMAGQQSSSQQSHQLHPLGGVQIPAFPNGKQSLQFEEFIEMIKESCMDTDTAENYLVYAFSMFDRDKKGYINREDLKIVFSLLNENVSDEELNTMIKIAGVKSNDKINFKEFVDFFYKAD